jgi:hypothetical protein
MFYAWRKFNSAGRKMQARKKRLKAEGQNSFPHSPENQIAHLGEDFSPRISRISRMGSSSLLIRVICEIRGYISLVAATALCLCVKSQLHGYG